FESWCAHQIGPQNQDVTATGRRATNTLVSVPAACPLAEDFHQGRTSRKQRRPGAHASDNSQPWGVAYLLPPAVMDQPASGDVVYRKRIGDSEYRRPTSEIAFIYGVP